MTTGEWRARVAILSPYWSFFAGTTDLSLAADREALLDTARRVVMADVDVVLAATVDPAASPEATIDAVRVAAADLLIIAATMAAPPEATVRIVDALPRLPVVLWAARRSAQLTEPFTHAGITVDGATVGAPQLANVLVRRNRPFDLVAAALDDPAGTARVREAVRAAATAAVLSRARVGRVGDAIAGYSCVEADAERLADEIGVDVVSVSAGEFRTRYMNVAPRAIKDACADVRDCYRLGNSPPSRVADACRAAIALRELAEHHRLDAGAFNCHLPEIRLDPAVGFAPCFALGESTSRGVPWTCTGDVLTAIAMLTAKRLSGAALYHEIEAYDQATGEFVIANSGEHDLALAAEPPRLRANPWWPAAPCAVVTPRPGPATLLGFTQLSAQQGHRFVAAGGRFTDRTFPDVGTSNAAFVFDQTPPERAWEAWCRSGVNHHAAASPGDYVRLVQRVADHLGMDATVI